MVGRARLKNAHGGAISVTPVLQNVTVRMGDHTNKNSGGVYLKNLNLTVPTSPPVLYWKISGITNVGGGAAGDLTNSCAANTAFATARTPLPSSGDNSNLTLTLAATSYTMTVTATGLDGVSTATCTLALTVVANAWNRGDDPVRDGVDAWNPFKTQAGGLTLLISTGADYSAANGWGIFDLKSLVPASGRQTVAYADTARPSQIPLVDILGCHALDVNGLGIGGGAGNKINLRDNGAGGVCDDVHCYDFYPLGATVADVGPLVASAGNNSFVVFNASTTNSSVERCELRYGGRGFVLNGVGNVIKGCTIRYFYGDGSAIGATTNCEFSGNRVYAPMRVPFDYSGSPDHLDMVQFSDSVTISGLLHFGNIFAQADGTGSASGIQSGATVTGSSIYGNIFMHRALTAANIGVWTSSTIRDNTWFLTGSGLIGNSSSAANDNIPNTVTVFTGTGTSGNVFLRNFITSGYSLDSSFTATSNQIESVTYPLAVQFPQTPAGGPAPGFNYEPDMGGSTFDFSSDLNYVNALERLNNYNASTNPNGTDYPNMTAAQITARILLILTPKSGGNLDLGASVTKGAVSLSGVQKVA
jgi:hypothetical protein